MSYKDEVRNFIKSYGEGWKDLDKTDRLDPICQLLGQSARGSRKEIIDRIERELAKP